MRSLAPGGRVVLKLGLGRGGAFRPGLFFPLALCLPLSLFLLVPRTAWAHATSISYSELTLDGRTVHGVLRFSLQDLQTQAPLDPKHLDPRALRQLVIEPFALREQGRPCEISGDVQAAMDGPDGVTIEASWTCPAPPEKLLVRVGFIDSFPIGHTHLSKITLAAGEIAQRVAQADEPSFEVQHATGPLQAAGRFLLLGVEHIFTGYDHIAFLVALLLLGGTLRALVKIVTAFTVAHSITLALAALEILAPSSRIVEPMIAVSIIYVGLEDLWALRARKADAALAHRWMLTFAFGLVHGFGFASVLRELQLPRKSLAIGLVTFNLGVELGQICIVAALLPLLAWLRGKPWFAGMGVRALAAIISALGAFWFVQRVFL